MIRAVIALAILGALAAPAHARGCHDSTHTVGREHCRGFGWWANGLNAWFDAGAAALRFDPTDTPSNPMKGSTARYTPLPGAVRATDYRVRTAVGIGQTFYLDLELGIASVTAAPDYVPIGGGATIGTVGGDGFVGGLYFGARAPLGPFVLGGELGPGILVVSYSSPDLRGDYFAADARFTLQARARADYFVMPNVSIGADIAADVVHHDGYFVGAMIGLHWNPYDRMR